jgi:transposase
MNSTTAPLLVSAAPPAPAARPRFCRPDRTQLDPHPRPIDELVAPDHPVRAVWEFVLQMNLTALEANYRAVEHHPGRPPIDVRLLVALWLYATLEGIASANQLNERCTRDDPFKWLCGGVSVNYHTLSDFRADHADWLAEQLTWSVAVLCSEGLVDLNRVGQDGLRVRASAGAGSFKRAAKLAEAYQQAQQHWQALQAELQENPGVLRGRQHQAQRRAARERLERVQRAQQHWQQIEAQREQRKKGDGEKARASTTDPEARWMKMPDGGYRPAYNVQFATTLDTLVVVGVAVTNAGTDAGQMTPMVEQVEQNCRTTPPEWYVDGGFATQEDITQASAQGTVVYAPIKEEAKKQQQGKDPYAPAKGDTPAVAAWRQRMGTAEAKAKYRARSLCEWTNATSREHGLTRLLVRGLAKVNAVALWHGLAVNFRRLRSLRAAAAAAWTRTLVAVEQVRTGTVRAAAGVCC